MEAKKHYATRYKEEIARLRNIVDDYYDAAYDAKAAVQNRNGLKAPLMHAGRPRLQGNEERMQPLDYEEVCKLIDDLPLITTDGERQWTH